MGYKIEQVNACTKKLSFDFASVDLSKQITEALKAKQKEANLKGFRKGKAPIAMVEKFYANQVENDALYRFISEEFFTAINAEKINPVGYPKFGQTKYEADKKTVEFEATVEVYPEFTIKDYSHYSIKKETVNVSTQDVANIVKQYTEGKVSYESVTTPIENGYTAVIDFVGEKENGEQPDSMKGTDFKLEIGSHYFIPGFEEKLIGCKKGDETVVALNFPENYHVEELKNAPVKFYVTIKDVEKKTYPEVDDTLATEFGFTNKEDMFAKIEKNLWAQNQRQADEKFHQEILEKLVADNNFDVPFAMVEEQLKHLQNEMLQTLKMQGFNETMAKEYFNRWGSELDKKAIFQVKSGLILGKLADDFKVEVTPADWNAKLAMIAEQSGMTAEKVEEVYGKNENVKKNLTYAIKEEKTFSLIAAQFKK